MYSSYYISCLNLCPCRRAKQRLQGAFIHPSIWGFANIRGTLLGVSIVRIVVFWGLYWGLLMKGNCHMSLGR